MIFIYFFTVYKMSFIDKLFIMFKQNYSTVTLFARLRGWSTSVPFSTAVK